MIIAADVRPRTAGRRNTITDTIAAREPAVRLMGVVVTPKATVQGHGVTGIPTVAPARRIHHRGAVAAAR